MVEGTCHKIGVGEKGWVGEEGSVEEDLVKEEWGSAVTDGVVRER